MRNTSTKDSNSESEFRKFTNDLVRELKKLLRHAVSLGKKHGRQNHPDPDAEDVRPFIATIVTGYESLKSKARAYFFNGQYSEWVQTKIENAKERMAKLKRAISEQEGIVMDARNELEDLPPPYDKEKVKVWDRIVLAMTVFEALLGAAAFQAFGFVLWQSILVGFLMGVFLWAVAHNLPNSLKGIQPMSRRWVIGIVISLAMGVLFFGIGSLRSLYVESDGIIDVSPLVFAVFNLIVFAGVVFVVWYRFPTKEQKEEMKQYEGLERRFKEEEEKLEVLRKEADDYEAEFKAEMEYLLKSKAEGELMLERIEKEKHRGIAEYKNSNLSSRDDRQVPKCFTNGSKNWEPDEHIQEF